MKLAISGKGGVGKTTVASYLALAYRDMGKKVIVVDADPDANLAQALGFPEPEKIVPISEMKKLIEERTGAKPGTIGGFFKLNPKVDDLPDSLSAEHNGIRLLVMGTVKSGGSGCVCPESALLKNLVSHLLLERDEVIILDMEAGIEHLGRATAFAVDVMMVVVEPGQRSIETAKNIKKLSEEIGIKKIVVVGCKFRNEDEAGLVQSALPDIPFLGYIPFSQKVIEADLAGKPPFEFAKELIPLARELALKLEEIIRKKGD